MKKLPLILIIISAAVVLSLCAVMLVDHLSKDNNDDRRIVTSLPENPSECVSQSKEYKTPDLQMVHAKGNVKCIKVTSAQSTDYLTTYHFDKEGWLLIEKSLLEYQFHSKEDGYDYKRNSQHQLVNIRRMTNSEFGGVTREYQYNKKGFVSKYIGGGYEHFWIGECTYDSNDNLIKIFESHEGDGDDYTETYTYSNYKLDSRGNWISRSVKYNNSLGSEWAEYINVPSSYTEKRKITYYD